jgi:hypothetical protein
MAEKAAEWYTTACASDERFGLGADPAADTGQRNSEDERPSHHPLQPVASWAVPTTSLTTAEATTAASTPVTTEEVDGMTVMANSAGFLKLLLVGDGVR